MAMMTSQILTSVDFTKQKSRYLENERLFFLQFGNTAYLRLTENRTVIELLIEL